MKNTKPTPRKAKRSKGAKGNVAKYDAYKEAYARINQSIEQDFFLEAIAIEEAIISDRLRSHLEHYKKLPKRKFPTLHDLVRAWQGLKQGADQEAQMGLPEMIDEWRKERNTSVHGLVTATSVDDFLTSAKSAAEQGKYLARAVCDWHGKQVKQKTK
jgi:hypothetical protein